MLNDLRTAFRTLWRAPGFVGSVVITLALGAGVSNALVAAIYAALLRPLPYADPARLVHLSIVRPATGAVLPASYPDYRDWSEGARSFERLAGYSRSNRTLTGTSTPARLAVTQVTANFFATLGVAPERGRVFRADEERDGADRVAVVTHDFWQRYLGGRTSALGETIQLSGVTYDVVGILPSGFEFALDSPALFVPLGLRPVDEARRDSHWLNVIGRLSPGSTMAQARSELATIASRTSTNAVPERIDVVALRDSIVGNLRSVLFVLAGAALLVMLAAAASVANLTATRMVVRRREVALRAALGGSRAVILRMILAEVAVLGAAAVAASWIVGRWTVALALAMLPSSVLTSAPFLKASHVDAAVLGAGALLVVLALLPSLLIVAANLSRPSVQSVLKSGSASARATSRLPLRGVPVALQVALAVVLIVGAALMTRSMEHLLSVGLGFEPNRLFAMSVSLPGERYQTGASVAGFYSELRREGGRLPGVEGIAVIDEMPLTKDDGAVRLYPTDRAQVPGQATETLIRSASPGYFETMGIRVLAGRTFSDADVADRPPVVVLSRALATALFPDRDPVGRSVALERNTLTFQVAGVVDDVRMGELDRAFRPAFYTCSLQDPSRSAQVIVRTSVPADEVVSAFREVLRSLDPDVPIYSAQTVNEVLANTRSVAARRIVLYPLVTFGVLTAIVAMFGLYGLLSYAVAQRTREIGIRLALGALPRTILRLAIAQGLGPATAGIVLGLAGAAAGTRWLTSALYGVGPFDVTSFAGAAGLVLAISLAAAFVPARRATRVDPAVTLRME
jgi:putative ABC transport system permease protein